MDDSFTHWRGGEKPRRNKNNDISITVSDTDEDSSLPIRDARSRIILESSDQDSDDNVFEKSRFSSDDDGISDASSKQSDKIRADGSKVSSFHRNAGTTNVNLNESYIPDDQSTDVDSENDVNDGKRASNNVLNESDESSDEPFTTKRRVNRRAIEDSDEETRDAVEQKTQHTVISDEKISETLEPSGTSSSDEDSQPSFENSPRNSKISDKDARSTSQRRDTCITVADTSISIVSDESDSDNDTDSDPAVQNDEKIENALPADDEMALSIVRKEVGINNLDPLVEQRRALLMCKIEQVQTQLAKTKMTLKTANIDMLPDKGLKLQKSVDHYETMLQELSTELVALPAPVSSQHALSTAKNSIAKPPPWKTLPASVQPKPLGEKALATQLREQTLTDERIRDLHGSLKAMPDENTFAEDPRGLRVPLMPHQQRALAWLLWREGQKPPGGILADDMGLGKTLTMIALIMASLKKDHADSESESDNEAEWLEENGRAKRIKGGTLVVSPASVLSQWSTEIQKRVRHGMLSVELYHGNNREKVPRRLAKNDVVITTYNLLGRNYKTSSSVLHQIKWKRIILDEAHMVRNHKSQSAEGVCSLHGHRRWALTGTPIQNKELDLYGLLKFLKCSPFDDIRVWKRWVDSKSSAGQQRLATVMKSLLLRRTKKELQAQGSLEDLPEKVLEEIFISLDPDEKLVYEKIMMYSRTIFATFLAQRAEKDHMYQLGAGNFNKPVFLQTHKQTQFTKVQNELLARHADVRAHEILVLLLRLRQVCCHPGLIEDMLDRDDLETSGIAEESANSDLTSGLKGLNLDNDENIDPDDLGVDRRVVQNLLTSENPVFESNRRSSKMRAVLAKIKEIIETGDKAVVVSQWTSMLEIVKGYLDEMKGASYDMLTGKVAVKNRQRVIEAFNAPNARPNILLLSLTAGGVGLNLIGGNHLLLLDIHWNPQLEAQAQDRVYRVGQQKNVHVYKFICEDTIEQRIKSLQDHKLQLAQGVLSGAGTAGVNKLTLDDLKSLFSL